jgi:uncharacterized protein Yka (UPF0111/DUF47 family)
MLQSPLEILQAVDSTLKSQELTFGAYDPSIFEEISVPKIEIIEPYEYSDSEGTPSNLSYYDLTNINHKQNAYIRFVLKENIEPKERVYYLKTASFSSFDKENFKDFPVPDVNDILRIEFYSVEWSRAYTDIPEGLKKLENILIVEESIAIAEQKESAGIPYGYDDPNSEFWQEEEDTEGDLLESDPYFVKWHLEKIGSKIYAYYYIICELKADYPDGDYPPEIRGLIFNFTGQITNLKEIYDGLYEYYLKGLEYLNSLTSSSDSSADSSISTKVIHIIPGTITDIYGKAINIFIDTETLIVTNTAGNIVDIKNGTISDSSGNVISTLAMTSVSGSAAVSATITDVDNQKLNVLIDSNTNFYDPNGSYIDLEYISTSQQNVGFGFSSELISGESSSSSVGYSSSALSSSSSDSGSGFFHDAYEVLDTVESVLRAVDFAIDKVDQILDKISKIPDAVENFINTVENAVEKISGMVEDFLNTDFIELLSNLPGMLFDLFMNLPIIKDIMMLKNVIVGQVTTLITTIASLRLPTSLKSAIRLIKQLKNILSMVKDLVDTVMSIPSTLKESLEKSKDYVSDTAMGAVNQVKDTVMAPVNEVIGAAQQGTSLITGIISDSEQVGAVLSDADDAFRTNNPYD